MWRELIRRARTDRPTWLVMALGMAMPGLRREARALAVSFAGDRDDLESAVAERFVAELYRMLETPGGRLVGIEVKAGATVRSEDLAGLRHLAALAEDRFVAGYVLYTGQQTLPFGRRSGQCRWTPSGAWQRPTLSLDERMDQSSVRPGARHPSSRACRSGALGRRPQRHARRWSHPG